MQKRYIPLAISVAAMLAVALTGYILPQEKQEIPARIVMDNTGGRVIFAHQFHVEEFEHDCTDCHHDGIDAETFLACGTCHPQEFNDDFRQNHQKAFEDETACLRCHDAVPTGELAEEDRPDIESIPLRAEAFHAQCMDCHEQEGGPFGEDSCSECHAR